MWFFILYIVVLALVAFAGLILVHGVRTRGSLARALNMSLFLVTLPREESVAGGQQEKELIAVMEQLLGSLTHLHVQGWNKFIYGDPYLALEIAVHHIGEEIHFYVATPRTYAGVFEKQIHGLFPNAHIEPVKEYNIFNREGSSVGAFLTLKQNPLLPIQTYRALHADPLGEIATALSKLQKEGEGAALQLLIRPTSRNDIPGLAQKVAREMQSGHTFAKALQRAGSSEKKKDDGSVSAMPLTPFEGELVKAIQTKASRPLFDANLRLVVSAESQPRAEQLLNDLSSSFVQFSATDMNSFQVRQQKGSALEKLLFNYSFRMFKNDQAMLLSSEEITSVYHFPIPSTRAPKLKYLKAKPSEPPSNLPHEGVVLGTNIFRGTRTPIHITPEDRRRHLYVLGQTGTGKSTFMENLMYQDIMNGSGVAFIDPHGSAIEKILGFIPEHRKDDVIVFDPSDVARPLGLNMLEHDARYPEQKTFIVNELLGIFQKLFSADTMGPMFDQYFRNAVLLLMDDYASETPTLVQIPRILTDVAYRKDKLTRETNPVVKNFWEFEAEKAGGDAALANMAPYITSKINGFIANEFLRPILSQKKSAFHFRDVMDHKKILLVNLSKGRIGDINAHLLGMIIVGKLLMAALSRGDMPEDQRPDFYLYIDEFQNFTTDSIATILSEARKYRLNLIVAHQFIKQLEEKIRNAIFGNVGSMAVFRVGADDAEYLKPQFEGVFTPQDMLNIDNFNAYIKMLIHNQTARPFNIKIELPQASDMEWGHALKQMSRLKYGLAPQ